MKNYSYEFNNKVYHYNIEINEEVYIAGADSLAFINLPDTHIAIISIDDYKIILKPVGSSYLIDKIHDKTYINSIPEYLISQLDINAEFNLNNLGIFIEERNHFEYILYKQDGEFFKESSIELHKHVEVLDSNIDSFLEELKTTAIFFIQGDYFHNFDTFLEEEEYFPPLAVDEFESFCDYNIKNNILNSNSF